MPQEGVKGHSSHQPHVAGMFCVADWIHSQALP
jgi:hypothetical protein